MKRKLRLSKKAGFAAVAGVALAILPTASAFASTTATSTENLTVTAGSLSVSNTQPSTITAVVDQVGTGALPSAVWADTTGSGDGWNGSIAATDLVYTGQWSGSSTLTNNSSTPFTDTVDGVSYTVKVTAVPTSTASGTFSYTSTDANDPSGTGTYTDGTAAPVGKEGLSITLDSSAVVGSTYSIHAGTQSPSAIVLDAYATGASITPVTGTTSLPPTFENSGTSSTSLGSTVLGGGTSPTAFVAADAVKFLSAAIDNGMGQYTVVPGAAITADLNSWAATYTAGIQYTIATGP